MKDEQEFLKQMENLQVPDIKPGAHPKAVKMAIMNAGRSAALGVWLIVVPCYFLACVLVYDFFNPKANWFSAMFGFMVQIADIPFVKILAPIVLMVCPMICIVINLLAIVHVQIDRVDGQRRKYREMVFTVKIKPLNLALIVLSALILFAFTAFLMTENISIQN